LVSLTWHKNTVASQIYSVQYSVVVPYAVGNLDLYMICTCNSQFLLIYFPWVLLFPSTRTT